MQLGTCNKNSFVDVDLDIQLCFPALPLPYYSNSPSIHTLQECSKKNLSIQEYERERERE